MVFEVPAERAAVASGDGTAVLFPDRHEKRMVFVVKLCIPREVIHEEGLDFVVGGLVGNQPMAGEDPPGVRVNDKDRYVPRIQKDGIRRFWTDPRDLEEGLPDPHGFVPEQTSEAPPVSLPEKGEEVLEPPRLDGKGAGRPDQRRQAPSGQG